MSNIPISKKLDSLTGLRGILAGLVVFLHATLFLEWKIPFSPIDKIVDGFGRFGVSGFFVLSGFILTYTYDNRTWRTKDFYINRFARIYPLYGSVKFIL